MLRFVFGAWLALFATPGLTHEYQVGDILIIHPYAHATVQGSDHTLGYLALLNLGENAERLLAVRTDFGNAVIHEAVEGTGPTFLVDGVDLPSGEMVSLDPDSLFIRFEGTAERPFVVGDIFDATLVFQQLGEVTVEFWIESRAAQDVTILDDTPEQAVDEPALASDTDIHGIREALIGLMGPGITISHTAVIETAALVGWYSDNEGGRAFVRKAGDAWTVEVLSGESLATPAGLRAQRLSPSAARALETRVVAAEVDLSPDVRTRIDSFTGTVFVDRLAR